MSVLSIEWLLLMSITVALFWGLPGALRHYFLIGLSALFLLVHDPLSLLLLLAMATVALLLCRQSRTSTVQVSGVIAGPSGAVLLCTAGYSPDT